MTGDNRYIIKYEIFLDDGSSIKDKEIKVSNCASGVHAQVRLEDYLKRKYINFEKLVVLECKEDPASIFSDLLGTGNDFFDISKIFGGKI